MMEILFICNQFLQLNADDFPDQGSFLPGIPL